MKSAAEGPETDPVDVRESGGDPVCWANRVCAECGRFADVADPEVCEVCGADFPD